MTQTHTHNEEKQTQCKPTNQPTIRPTRKRALERQAPAIKQAAK